MEIFLFFIIIFVASVLQASTGFGFSILATPFLLLLFQPAEAIQINLILSLFISLSLMGRVSKDIDKGILKRLVLGSTLGLPIGMIIFLFIDIEWLKIAIGLMVLVLTILMMLQFRLHQTSGRDLGVGSMSGALTTSIGMPGPPLLLYFSGTDTEKKKLRGTTLAFYLFIYVISLLIQMIFAGTTKTVWISSGAAIPIAILGIFAGQILFKWVSQRVFQIFTYIILLFTGLYLLVESLW
ncbi:sulfite exporter TauE/SafE family protein [Cytobacillus purgationiresistens]|uniref:Probable membrane transporter protein n=1 Tax=Cytobacillus purgationiresistens TaxID=863449 RepID=A0ABU0AKT4_9BACI|nr:sulfite exporter TauE/SafE family protein [Cytobacillus purgationiresistens]MDQ0271873.1 putative membrane protein YfcA [Cytobacillus purgationiresistens]